MNSKERVRKVAEGDGPDKALIDSGSIRFEKWFELLQYLIKAGLDILNPAPTIIYLISWYVV